LVVGSSCCELVAVFVVVDTAPNDGDAVPEERLKSTAGI